jgi:cytochrome c-type biogenesis protein CcmH/NrfG
MPTMTSRRTTTSREIPSVEAILLTRLGLPAKASSQEVEAAHDGLVEYLERAPGDVQGWARQQIRAIDEAFALLSDPTIDRSALTGGTVAAQTRVPAPPTTTVRVAKGEPVAQPTDATDTRLIRRIAMIVVAAVGVVAIAFTGYNLNGGSAVPPINGSPAPQAAASPGIDAAQVGVLMQRIQADPKDVASLQSLADLYYQAGDYKTSGIFLEKVLAVDPKNLTGLLALGAVEFNLGDMAGAEEDWRAALVVDPKSVEAHYDLGFMYLSKTPPDMANVKLEWGEVVKIDPNSSVAKSVATHLASLASPAPSAK